MNDAVDSVYDLEDEESNTAGEPHVIYDDPEKLIKQQEKQKELIRANQNLEKGNRELRTENEELREDYERVIPPYDIIETNEIDGKKRTQTIHVDPYKRKAWSEQHHNGGNKKH
jgi:predicted RNase H-like nuclease (RuvC/YqgF family)